MLKYSHIWHYTVVLMEQRVSKLMVTFPSGNMLVRIPPDPLPHWNCYFIVLLRGKGFWWFKKKFNKKDNSRRKSSRVQLVIPCRISPQSELPTNTSSLLGHTFNPSHGVRMTTMHCLLLFRADSVSRLGGYSAGATNWIRLHLPSITIHAKVIFISSRYWKYFLAFYK